MDYFVFTFLGLSLLGNAAFAVLFYKKKYVVTHTVDAKELLAQIMSGPAIVKIDVMDPTSFFVRSPRG
jgi:hypothetical protein